MELLKEFQNTSKRNIFMLCILGINCSLLFPFLSAYPVWFKQPVIICKSNTKEFNCSENYACSTKNITYIVDKSKSLSLSTRFSLICGKRSEQRKAISRWNFCWHIF